MLYVYNIKRFLSINKYLSINKSSKCDGMKSN